MGLGTLGGMGGGGGGGGGIPFFGLRDRRDGALEGWFYDLKQNRSGGPTKMAGPQEGESCPQGLEYTRILRRFVEQWSTGVFDGYYKSRAPLYAPQIYIPIDVSGAAGKAFGQEHVEPNRWVVHYKGAAIAPKTGKFRFVGLGDNLLVVRLNGKVVLDSPPLRYPQVNTSDNLGPAGPAPLGRSWNLMGGAWFDLHEGQRVDIEVVIGDTGGWFSAYLLIEEQGATYERRPDAPNFSAYPVFQLSNAPVPPAGPGPGGANPATASKPMVFRIAPRF
jgi:hypothetical protein